MTWFLCFFGLVGQARAIDATTPLNLLERTAFHAREGAPGDIQAVTQASDGMLWIGTSGGLYQFDGVSFRRYQPPMAGRLPDSNIVTLATAPDGGLWATTRFGHVYFITHRSLRVFGAADGLPEHTLFGLAVGTAGQVWVGSKFGVFRLVHDRWQEILKTDGTHAHAAIFDCLKMDGHGNLWMYDEAHLSVLRPDARRITMMRDVKRPEAILVDRQGEAWLSDESGLYSLSDSGVGIAQAQLPGPGLGPDYAFAYFIDAAGMAWGLTATGEGFRIPLPRALPAGQAMASARSFDLFAERLSPIDVAIRPFWLEDPEGNVWIASSSGLDRFRATKFHRVVIDGKAIGAGGLAVSRSGVLWTESDAGLYRKGVGEKFAKINIGNSLRCPNCAVFATNDGSMYRGHNVALERLGKAGFEPAPQPLDRAGEGQYNALAESDDGTLWVSVTHGRGVFSLKDGTWSKMDGRNGIPSGSALSATSSGGRVWLGYLHGGVAVIENGASRLLGERDGLAIGNVLVVVAHGRSAWLAGGGGLACFDGDKVRTVLAKGRPWVGISGLVQTPDGDLWLNTEEGVHRISNEELAAFLADPSHRVADEVFDFHAGIEGSPAQSSTVPTAAATPDGLLWFSTSTGLFSIDPRHIASNRVAPQVAILSVQSNGATFSGDSVRIPPGSAAIEITYSAPVLGVPEKARFKYRLDGVDTSWQDANNRRSAFYTNLAPGSYRFRVMAANEDGVWSERPANLTLDIAPTFWQTTWFRGGLMLLGSAVITLVGILWHRVHVRRLSRALKLEAGIQQAERERIARDLHDTLMQNMYALVWRMDVISRTFAIDDGRRGEMEEALDRAEKALGTGRQRIFAPREPESEVDQTFVERLRELGKAWASDTGVAFVIDINDEFPLRPEVVWLLERILSEAVVNAFRHAGASQVKLNLQFDDDELRCVVSDDGAGIPLEFLERSPDGHLGLGLMRHRAATLGARLRILAGAGGGTEVSLTLTSRKAYARGRVLRRLATGLRPLRERFWPSTRLPRDVPAVCE